MTHVDVTFLIVLVGYFAAVLALAVRGYRRTRTAADFIVAGRSLGAVVGGATLAATQISAGTFVGTIGIQYLAGVSFAWVWPGVWLGWLVSAVFVAPKLRAFGALTVPDYLAVRFHSRAARALGALLIVVAYTVYLTAQYQGSGIIVHTVLGLPEWSGIALILASTVLYSLLGGLHAGARIDLLQTVVMMAGLIGAVPYLMHHVGGFGALARALAAIDPRLTGWYFGARQIVAFGASFGLSIAATPLEITRYYSMRDRATTRYAIGVSYAVQAVIAASILMIGLAMRALFPTLPSADLASSVMTAHVLTPVAGSLLIIAAFSAIMSTCNAIMLVAAASVAHDLYATFVDPDASDATRLAVNRIAILVLGLVPVWFALHPMALVQFVVLFEANLVASFFFAPVVVGLNWRRATRAGALSGMLGGVTACVLAQVHGAPYVLGVEPIFAGTAASLGTFVVVSWLTPPPPREALAPFFADV